MILARLDDTRRRVLCGRGQKRRDSTLKYLCDGEIARVREIRRPAPPHYGNLLMPGGWCSWCHPEDARVRRAPAPALLPDDPDDDDVEIGDPRLADDHQGPRP